MNTHYQTTLRDIALKLNISVSTVSRALRDHPDVNHATKVAVRKLAEEMNYAPNPLALGLLKNRSNIIAVVIPKIGYHLYANAISGIEEAVTKEGYHLVIAQTHESMERESAVIRELIGHRAAGFIVSVAGGTSNFDHFKLIQKMNVPLVFINRDCEEVAASRVIIDNEKAAYRATQHLLEQGYRRVAFIAASELVQISNKRLDGYRKALKDSGITPQPDYIEHCYFSKEPVKQATFRLLSRSPRPDALLVFSDQMAYHALMACRELGCSIPQDLAIVSFNDEPLDEMLQPPLTSVAQPGFEMGKIAGEMISATLKSKEGTYKAETKILDATLVVRASSCKL